MRLATRSMEPEVMIEGRVISIRLIEAVQNKPDENIYSASASISKTMYSLALLGHGNGGEAGLGMA